VNTKLAIRAGAGWRSIGTTATTRPDNTKAFSEACQVVALAADLLAWLPHLTLDGALAVAEPTALRYRLLHSAARITRGQRHHWINIPPPWPWADDLTTAFTRVLTLPAPQPAPT